MSINQLVNVFLVYNLTCNYIYIYLFLCFRLSGISPFAGDDVMETYANIGQCDYDFDCEEFDECSDAAIDFIERLLVRKPG